MLAAEIAARSQQPEIYSRLAAFDGRPADFVREVLGLDLFEQQVEMLEALEANKRVVLCSSTSYGKSTVLHAWALYRFLVLGSVAGSDGRPQGCILVLMGPSAKAVFDTAWRKILGHAKRAEARGFEMPGKRSEASITWECDADRWYIRHETPARSAGDQDVADVSQGKHSDNLVIAIEECRVLTEGAIKAAEGMAQGADNRIAGCMNPTKAQGAVFRRIRRGDYQAFHFSALRHPNVTRRATVVPGGAVSHLNVEERIRHECTDLGPATSSDLDAEKLDFVYALPGLDVSEIGPRTDSVPGHPAAEPHVFRPRPEELATFAGQVLGVFPTSSVESLVRPDLWDEAVERWQRRPQPEGWCSRVGVDASRWGEDLTMAAPSWGDTGRELLSKARDLMLEGVTRAEVRERLASERIYVGRLETAPKSNGFEIAQWLTRRFSTIPRYLVDAGYGAQIVDPLKQLHGCAVEEVSFGGTPNVPLPGHRVPDRIRAEMYLILADLVHLGLVDLPPDEDLRDEVLALEIVEREGLPPGRRQGQSADRRPLVGLTPKDEVKQRLDGRSPDRGDAVALSLYEVVSRTGGAFGTTSVGAWG